MTTRPIGLPVRCQTPRSPRFDVRTTNSLPDLKDRIMPRIRLSFTEHRRRRLALKVDRLDRMEKRSTVTPFSAFSLAAGAFQGLAQVGLMQGNGNAQGGPVLPGAETQRAGTQPQASGSQAREQSSDLLPIRVAPARRTAAAAGRRSLRTRPARQGSRSRPTTN